MASIRENASIVLSASRQMKAIIELAEQIGEIEQLENQRQAIVNEINSFAGKIMDAKKELAEVQADIPLANEEAAKVRKEAAAYAKRTKDVAEEAAKS